MKVLVVLSVMVACATAASISPGELQMLEAFDFDALFANDEQKKIVFDCILDKGECGEYKQLAELALKVIKSKCADCSPAQKTKYEHVLKQLQDQYEPIYNEIMEKVAAMKE